MKKKNLQTRILAVLMAVTMMAGFFPVSVSATEGDPAVAEETVSDSGDATEDTEAEDAAEDTGETMTEAAAEEEADSGETGQEEAEEAPDAEASEEEAADEAGIESDGTADAAEAASEDEEAADEEIVEEVTVSEETSVYAATYLDIDSGATVTVADALVSKGSTTVEISGLPSDFSAVYTVTDPDGAAVDSSYKFKATATKITYNKKTTANTEYLLTVSDKNGIYADISATFELLLEAPLTYDAAKGEVTVDWSEMLSYYTNGFLYVEFSTDTGEYVQKLKSDYKWSEWYAYFEIIEENKIPDEFVVEGATIYEITICATGYEDFNCTFIYEETSQEEGLYAELADTEWTYTGSAIKPTVSYVYYSDGEGNTTVLSTKNYSVSYKNNKDAGTATATVTGKGDYKGLTVPLEFTIAAKSLEDSDVAASAADVLYKNENTTSKVTVKWNKKTLNSKTDYNTTDPDIQAETGKTERQTAAMRLRSQFTDREITQETYPLPTGCTEPVFPV